MNIVLEDAEEISLKRKTRKGLGTVFDSNCFLFLSLYFLTFDSVYHFFLQNIFFVLYLFHLLFVYCLCPIRSLIQCLVFLCIISLGLIFFIYFFCSQVAPC
jgi:hypothetical protein